MWKEAVNFVRHNDVEETSGTMIFIIYLVKAANWHYMKNKLKCTNITLERIK